MLFQILNIIKILKSQFLFVLSFPIISYLKLIKYNRIVTPLDHTKAYHMYSYIYLFYLVCSSKLIATQMTSLAFAFLLILFINCVSLYLSNLLENLICFGMGILSLIFLSLLYANFYLNVKLVLLFVKDLETYFDVKILRLPKLETYCEQENFLLFFNMSHFLLNFKFCSFLFGEIIQVSLNNFKNKYFVNPFEFTMNLILIIKAIVYTFKFLSYLIFQAVSKQGYGFKVFKNLILKFYIICQPKFCISRSQFTLFFQNLQHLPHLLNFLARQS